MNSDPNEKIKNEKFKHTSIFAAFGFDDYISKKGNDV